MPCEHTGYDRHNIRTPATLITLMKETKAVDQSSIGRPRPALLSQPGETSRQKEERSRKEKGKKKQGKKKGSKPHFFFRLSQEGKTKQGKTHYPELEAR